MRKWNVFFVQKNWVGNNLWLDGKESFEENMCFLGFDYSYDEFVWTNIWYMRGKDEKEI